MSEPGAAPAVRALDNLLEGILQRLEAHDALLVTLRQENISLRNQIESLKRGETQIADASYSKTFLQLRNADGNVLREIELGPHHERAFLPVDLRATSVSVERR